ncbi:phage holin family protein [Porphyromonadaceae bacterium]
MEKLIVTLWITFGIYILVLLAILADLWSGVRKAQKNGIARSSYGFKRTVDKVSRYYNVLLALSVIDAMQMVSFWYLETYYAYHIPIFPFVTLVGAICLCSIEILSIYEKAEDKVRIENVGLLAGKIIANKDDLSEIVKTILTFLKEQKSNPDNQTS